MNLPTDGCTAPHKPRPSLRPSVIMVYDRVTEYIDIQALPEGSTAPLTAQLTTTTMKIYGWSRRYCNDWKAHSSQMQGHQDNQETVILLASQPSEPPGTPVLSPLPPAPALTASE